MAEETEKVVILTKAKSFTDGKYKFKQGVGVTMPAHIAKRYEKNYYFSIRSVKQNAAFKKMEATPKVNPDSLDNATVSHEQAAVKKKKTKKVAKKVAKKVIEE